jgi:folate-binding protein YgfZ
MPDYDMERLTLHEFHQALGARFETVNDSEVVADYGDLVAEENTLSDTAGILDLSFRSRLCLTGADRVRFLHGQATNDIKKLRIGQGCYAALVSAKGRMESDLNVYCLADELLLDFEPGLSGRVTQRLESFIVADDVQVMNVAPHYGLLSVQGPRSAELVKQLELFPEIPSAQYGICKAVHSQLGELYLSRNARLAGDGFDLFIPTAATPEVAEKLFAAGKSMGSRPVGWQAFETNRIEAGMPRFGLDMDDHNLPQECGIEDRAVSYSKGCYIGQEVLNRVHTMGHVNRALRVLELGLEPKTPPCKGDKLLHEGKEVGFVTSAAHSARLRTNIALGYVRREVDKPGTILTVLTSLGQGTARIAELPLKRGAPNASEPARE